MQPLLLVSAEFPERFQESSHLGYTSNDWSKLTPTPATNTDSMSDRLARLNGLHSTYQQHSCLSSWRRTPKAVSNATSKDIANIMMLQQHTRATHDSTSSGPIPAPRTRPRRRKPTTAAQMTHSTAIAMSASRACLVMAMYSAPAMMDNAWRRRRGV